MKRLIYTVLLLLFCCAVSRAQDAPLPDHFEYTDEYLDTAKVSNIFKLNDYWMVGVEYGVSFVRQQFVPKFSQETMMVPGYYGVTLTKYSKMFGYMPYFGFQIGFYNGYEGYRFKMSKETGFTPNLEGAEQVVMQIYEVPFLTQIHYDTEYFKLIGLLGIYGAYRNTIERTGPYVSEEIAHSYRSFDYRYDYGLQGGAGFGLVFSPFELHITAKVRYSWSSLFEPGYRQTLDNWYAYPFDVIVSGSLHFHLSKRNGRSRADLRREAKRIVYEEEQQN